MYNSTHNTDSGTSLLLSVLPTENFRRQSYDPVLELRPAHQDKCQSFVLFGSVWFSFLRAASCRGLLITHSAGYGTKAPAK